MKPSTVKALTQNTVLWGSLAAAIFLMFIATYNVFVYIPDDYLQGVYFKILYIHVPAAWLSLGLYVAVAGFAGLYLVMSNPIYDIVARAIAEIGIMYTFLTLLSGAIWGKPTWGTWWVWDARLTSMLLLFFIYAAYLALRANFTNQVRAAKVASIFALIGLVNIPIIKFSVYLWSTLHQKSTFFKLAPSMHSSMLPPLLLMASGLLLWTVYLVGLRIRIAMLRCQAANSRRRARISPQPTVII